MYSMNDNTLISSKKYKTVGNLLKAPLKSILLVANNEKNKEIQNYLYNWLYINHYSNILMDGSLTQRVHNISNKAYYYYIMKNCFNENDILNNGKTDNILNEDCCNFIGKLHNIEPSLTGCFIDYLIRRIISEILNIDFNDNRANSKCYNKYSLCDIFDEEIEYNIINSITLLEKNDKYLQNCIILFDKDNLNNELDFCEKYYKGYKVIRSVESYKGYNVISSVEPYNDEQNIYKLFVLENNIILITTDEYNEIIKPDKINNLPINMCKSYEKTKNTALYKSEDILLEIFITSLSHTLDFGGIPKEDKITNIINLINTTNNINEIFVLPLKTLCENLLKNHNNILLNPTLGSIETHIASDCDLIINDTIFDFKCTIGNKSIYELLQLLGYTSLSHYNTDFNIKINNISIINLLQGKLTTYNISSVTSEELMNYLKILTKK